MEWEVGDIYRWLKGQTCGYANGRCQEQLCCFVCSSGQYLPSLIRSKKHFDLILVALKDSQTFMDPETWSSTKCPHPFQSDPSNPTSGGSDLLGSLGEMSRWWMLTF